MPPKKKIDVKAAKKAELKVAKSPSKDKPLPKSKPEEKKSKTVLKAKSQDLRTKKHVTPPQLVSQKGKRSARKDSPSPQPAKAVPVPVPPPEPKKQKNQKQSKPKTDKKAQKNDKSPPKVQPKVDDKKVKVRQKDSKVVDTDDNKPKDTAVADDLTQKMVKVVLKGGAAVDNLVPGKQNFRVYQQGGKNYAVTLNFADMIENNNKFYIVQMLLNEKSGSLHVWNRWGRVGVPGQNCLKGPFTKDKAISQYNSKIRQKTAKGYKQIQIKYDDDQQQDKKQQEKKPKKQNNIASKMDEALQKLIGLIFDVTIMNNTMKQIGYDAKKMPLGKLGQNTIKQAYNVLNKLTKAIQNGQKSQYPKLSSQFFTLIPHDVGFAKMNQFILDNQQKVKQKLRMLQAISDMKITTKLLDQAGDEDTSVHDQNYKKLGCNIKSLNKKSQDYNLLKQYFDNTKGGFAKVSVGDIYQIERPTQHTLYDSKLGNNMLLWHGSRIANFVGILSQGLRIAPPEAPVSGYLFGKGIYLADLAEKSIHYCRSGTSQKALILLIQGAIGNPNILLTSSYQAKQLMQKNGKNSTKCHGAKAPPTESYVNFKGMIVPKGKPAPTNSGSYMGHNQYIVYNMNQARIRYVIQMDMNGG